MPDTTDTHHHPAAGGTPLRVLGAVAVAASVGTIALGNLFGRSRRVAAARAVRDELRRLELARRDLDHRLREVEAALGEQAARATVAARAAEDLEAARAAVTEMIRQAEEVQQAFPPAPAEAA